MTPSAQPENTPSPQCDVTRFCDWLASALPGDRIEYHRGFLSVDRSAHTHRLPDRQRRQFMEVADFAMTAADDRRVALIQRRLGDDDYSYIAVKMGGRS